ncbi:MAG: hypothetical protein EXR61_05970 [Chloroflexi bacterium]|nr:hypothetical protein [Chloroflexota bacterium]
MTGPPLRPLGVGEIVDRTITLFRADLRLFVGVAAVPYLVVVILGSLPFFLVGSDLAHLIGNVARQATARDSFLENSQAVRDLIDLLPIMVGFGLLVAAVTVAQSAALIDAAAARHLGRTASIGSSVRVGVRATPRLIVIGLAARGLRAAGTDEPRVGRS